jgi:hypothetical protein
VNNNTGTDDAIADTSAVYYPSTNADAVTFEFDSQHADSTGEGKHAVYLLYNADMKVTRYTSTDSSDGFREIASNLDVNVQTTHAHLSRCSSGTGTAYPRGWGIPCFGNKKLGLQIQYSGNTIRSRIQLVEFNPTQGKQLTPYQEYIIDNLDVVELLHFDNDLNDLAYGFHGGTFSTMHASFENEFACYGSSKSLTLDSSLGTNTYFLNCSHEFSNLKATTERTISMWFMVESIQDLFIAICKEGGGLNNVSFFLGFGNALMVQVTDIQSSPTQNIQLYSDVLIEPMRPYNITMTLKTDGGYAKLYIDGVLQDNSKGNPFSATELSSHSDLKTIGGTNCSLNIAGKSVSFYAISKGWYSHWCSFKSELSGTDIKNVLVEKGLPASYTIYNQADLDALANTVLPNYSLSLRIEGGSDDLELTADNITVNERTSYHIQWTGTGKLTFKNINGSDISIGTSLYGGDIDIVSQKHIVLKIVDAVSNTPIEDARVYFTDFDRYEVSDVNGEVSIYEFIATGADVIATIRKSSASPFYKSYKQTGTITGEENIYTIPMVKDE